MPVACCCHQFKNWWLRLFLPSGQKCKQIWLAAPKVDILLQKDVDFYFFTIDYSLFNDFWKVFLILYQKFRVFSNYEACQICCGCCVGIAKPSPSGEDQCVLSGICFLALSQANRKAKH